MRAIHCGVPGSAGSGQNAAGFQTPLTVAWAGGSRAALLAGASIVALATFGGPSPASACSGLPQTISMPVTGPILSTNGAITVTSSGSVIGNTDGVDAFSCSISTLTNSGTISGAGNFQGTRHGVGVASSNTITMLTNYATIIGGMGTILVNDAASGILNSGTVKALSNNGTIAGGGGYSAPGQTPGASGGDGGMGLSNNGTVTMLTNNGMIRGGDGGVGPKGSGEGGVGIFNNGGTIGSLVNSAGKMISGGNGGSAASGHAGSQGGTGIINNNVITILTNQGIIQGGEPGAGAGFGTPGGGNGVQNGGMITTLTNSGLIKGGRSALGISAGAITTLTNTGVIGGGDGGNAVSSGAGGRGGAGVYIDVDESIGSLNNDKGGMITGGAGGAGTIGVPGGAGGAGGVAVSNFGSIAGLTNSGMINGGAGGLGLTGGAGGAGVLNAAGATITTIINNNGATIAGNAGGSGLVHGGPGGAGLSNSGMIGTSGPITLGIDNEGSILGGFGGSSAGVAGAGVSNTHGGTIAVLSNSGTIRGGEGSRGVDGGVGGAGVINAGTITALTNNTGAMISGGRGGSGGGFTGVGGMGGAGVSNTGTITTLTNNGTISAGGGGFGSMAGAPGTGVRNTGAGVIGTLVNLGMISGGTYAIYSPGAGSIGSLTSPTGHTMGNVVVDPVAPFVITGGSGKNFGFFSDGTITVLGGDLRFEGNIDLADNINVNSGAGTVTNDGVLRLATPETIDGNFAQTSSSVLELLLGGDMSGEYGALNVTGGADLDGELALATTGGFHLAGGDTFDLMSYSPDGGSFSGVSLDGVACTATLSTVWDCGGGTGFNLDLVIGTSGVQATILSIPEPSTWAMLATGFLGLAGLGLRGRRTALRVEA